MIYLDKFHYRDWVEEVNTAESVQPVGGAGDIGDGQGGCVTGKDGVSKTHRAQIRQNIRHGYGNS